MNIPNDLGITNHTDEDSLENKNLDYKLYGVINHFGNISFGHYNSLIKLNDIKKWVCFDDKNVTQLDKELHKISNAYILIYQLNNIDNDLI